MKDTICSYVCGPMHIQVFRIRNEAVTLLNVLQIMGQGPDPVLKFGKKLLFGNLHFLIIAILTKEHMARNGNVTYPTVFKFLVQVWGLGIFLIKSFCEL